MTGTRVSESREWYVTEEQAEAYMALMEGQYGSMMVQEEDNLLTKNLERICNSCQERVEYVDLGPGDGRKTKIVCQGLYTRGKLGSYTAVDIQPRFLGVADEISQRFRVPTRKHKGAFEDFLTSTRLNGELQSLIYLGSTYANFLEGDIEGRLTRFMREGDLVYLSSGLLPEDIEELEKSYIPSLQMFKPIVEAKGLKGGKLKVRFNDKTSAVEQVYEVDDEIIVIGSSKKHTEESFREQVLRYFKGEFYMEGKHIGFLGTKK